MKPTYQVTFSNQSMGELAKLQLQEQLELVEQLSEVTPEQLARPREPLSKFRRRGTTFYRLRAGEFRVYFEVNGNILYSHYMLHRNTLTDFIFRSKLPISEEQMVEQYQSFWRYLESLKKDG